MNDMTLEDINNLYLRLTGNVADPQTLGYLSEQMNPAPQQQVPMGLLGGEPRPAAVPPEIANAFMQSLLYQTQLPAASRMENPLAMRAVNIPSMPELQRIDVGATALPAWLAEAAAKK